MKLNCTVEKQTKLRMKNASFSPVAGCSSPDTQSSWPPHPQASHQAEGVKQVHSLTGLHCHGMTGEPKRHSDRSRCYYRASNMSCKTCPSSFCFSGLHTGFGCAPILLNDIQTWMCGELRRL